MALPRRYLLKGDCFLNNQFVEAGTVILWDPDKANDAMVPCDAKGRPLTRAEVVEVEPVQTIEVEKPADTPEIPPLDENQRKNLIAVAVKDVLDNDNESDWTQKGEIRIDVIRQATGIEDITREEINEATAAIEEDEQERTETEEAKAKAAVQT